MAEYKRKGRGSLGRLQAALNHRREHFEGWAAREVATEALPRDRGPQRKRRPLRAGGGIAVVAYYSGWRKNEILSLE